MSRPDFHDDLVDDVVEFIIANSSSSGIFEEEIAEAASAKKIQTKKYKEELENNVRELVELLTEYYFAENYNSNPPRQLCSGSRGGDTGGLRQIDPAHLARLRDMPQPAQKTAEWYAFRANIITSSNLWKIFGTENQQKSLIAEKIWCGGGDDGEMPADNRYLSNNTGSAVHWGNKLEPVTAAIYERRYGVKLGEFGCIVHPTYPFIGASPDGIVVEDIEGCGDVSSSVGRMVEIKNIVNRDITGIPKKEYWIQTQIQMEVCDLDVCDFVETRFKLFADEDAFYACTCAEGAPRQTERGVILYFVRRHRVNVPANIMDTDAAADSDDNVDDNHEPSTTRVFHFNGGGGTVPAMSQEDRDLINKPLYIYMPLDLTTREDIDAWIAEQRATYAAEYILFEKQYWYLDEFCCTVIPRNRAWFSAVLPDICAFWGRVLAARRG